MRVGLGKARFTVFLYIEIIVLKRERFKDLALRDLSGMRKPLRSRIVFNMG